MNEEKENPRRGPGPVEFTSRLSRGEALAVFVLLPLHLAVLPTLFALLMEKGLVDAVGANLAIYLTGFVYVLLFTARFLRRDFDALCDRPFQVVAEILGSYGVLLCCNLVFSMLLGSLVGEENPNNASVAAMVEQSRGPMAAVAVFLAPITEEVLFRAGVFGVLRHYSRRAAYAVAVLGFSLCHVLGYALTEPLYWIYLLQYIPASFLLCRCYESTNSIWCSIFFHMLVNGVSVKLLGMM